MSEHLTKRIMELREIQNIGGMSYARPVPKIVCADGFCMSVQASSTHYCEPRDNDGPWSKFEVGFPSAREETLMPFCEDSESPTETVYGYVPGDIIERIIKMHGGLQTRPPDDEAG